MSDFIAINADKPRRWKEDIAASVDQYNQWFINFAPLAYRETRSKTVVKVQQDLKVSDYLTQLTPAVLETYPDILPTLRMSTAPPLARDRLVGLANVNKSLVQSLEHGKLPTKMSSDALNQSLNRICDVINHLIDRDLFPWTQINSRPEEVEQTRASTVVADRLCGAVADPIIRNAQEIRQLEFMGSYLTNYGYIHVQSNSFIALADMKPGTFCIRRNVPVGDERRVNIPIDVVIQPHRLRVNKLPIFIETKSAGDFTNTNKRRKEEATKIRQLRDQYGQDTQLILFLCGYFNTGYLGYEAAEGLDWVWEHRIEDLLVLEILP